MNDFKDVCVFKDFDDILDDVKKVGNEICEIIKWLGEFFSLKKSVMYYIKIVILLEMEE